jgi:hypothetical protein
MLLAKRFISFSFHPQRFLLYWRGVHLRFCRVDWCVWLFIIMMKRWNLCLRKIFSGGFVGFVFFFPPFGTTVPGVYRHSITLLLRRIFFSFLGEWKSTLELVILGEELEELPPCTITARWALSGWEQLKTDSAANGRSFYLPGNGRGFLNFFLKE